MSSNASSQSTMPMLGPVDQDNTLAFAKLQGDGVTFYMQNLEITIGRIYPHKKHADLGITYDETVSKCHAVLYYDFYTMRYSLTVTGRSGVFVQEKLVAIGTTVPLKHNDSIQIGDAKFKFILPNNKILEQTRSASQSSTTDYRVPTVEAVSGDDDDSSDFYSVKSDDEDSTRNNTVNHNWTHNYKVEPEDDNSTRNNMVDHNWTNDYRVEPDDDDSTVSEDWANGEFKHNDVDLASDGRKSNYTRENYADIINSYKHKPNEPPFPLYIIIACAILECGNHTLTIGDIREYILNNYPYYTTMDYDDFKDAVHSNFYHRPIKFVSTRVGHNNFLWSIAEGYEDKVKEQVYAIRQEPSTVEPYIAIERPKDSTPESTPEPTHYRQASETTRHRQIIPKAVHIAPSTIKKIDAYKDVHDEPPFALPVLIMRAMHESGKGYINSEEAITFLHTNYPFYRDLKDQKDLRKKIKEHFNGKFFSFAGRIDQEFTFKMNPDRPYDIDKYVRRAIKNELKVKKYFETVGDRKTVYNLDVIHDYRFQKEEPPFSYCILAAYAVNESPLNEVTMAYILDFIIEHFPFYKSVTRRTLQFRVRSSMKQRSNVVIILPNRHEVLYALHPDMSKERVIHDHINECLKMGNCLGRLKKPVSKRIKLDDE